MKQSKGFTRVKYKVAINPPKTLPILKLVTNR